MATARLSQRRVDALKPRRSTYDVRDRELKGFGTRVLPSGAKRYFIHSQHDGRRVWKIVGEPGAIGLDEARERARAMLASIRDGTGGQTAAAPDILFEAVADEVFRRYARNWKPSTLEVNRNYYRNHILPWFEGRPIADIDVRDVRRWFASLHNTPASADRSAPILSVIMRQAEIYGYRPAGANPCTGIRRYRRRGRERFLSTPEFRRLGKVLARHEADHPQAVAIVRLLLLTGCRKGEIVSLKWRYYREAFVPLHHPPGHAQVDFGEATVEVAGRREKVAFFRLILPHSDVWFVKAYPRETTEAFLDGHVGAFAFLGGVPRSILYDNTTLAVARILGDGTRQRTRAFTHLQSHFLFRDRFGRPGKGNDKGKVEALVKTARRKFMVPVPKVHDLDALNERLLARCLERLDALEQGEKASSLLADLDALRDRPAAPFEACEHVPGQVSSTSLVRYRLVDYSAPTVHAHKKVTIKGYVDRVEIALGAEIVARHRRSYVRGNVVYDPLHYLSLLEKKPGALDQAAPLRGWKLDPAFDALRRLLEARFGPRGKREYIQVLRLLEDFPETQVTAAVRDAVKRRLIGFDAVKHLLLARIERRPAHLDLARYPHLPQPFVAATRTADYASLLAAGAGHG